MSEKKGLFGKIGAGIGALGVAVGGMYMVEAKKAAKEATDTAIAAVAEIAVDKLSQTDVGQQFGITPENARPLIAALKKKSPDNPESAMDKFNAAYDTCRNELQQASDVALDDPTATYRSTVKCLVFKGHAEELNAMAENNPDLAAVLQELKQTQ